MENPIVVVYWELKVEEEEDEGLKGWLRGKGVK